MADCWHFEAPRRPGFSSILDTVEGIFQQQGIALVGAFGS